MATQSVKSVQPGIKPSEATAILIAMFKSKDKHSCLFTGAPGVGKTSIMKQAAAAAGQKVVFTDLGTADPTNANGFPWITGAKGKERAVFIPFGDVQTLMDSKEPIVWVWDDLGWAPDSVQKAFAHGLDEGRFGDIILPKHVTVVAATNRRDDRAGVTGILEPVKSRFTTILPLVPNFIDFRNWWLSQNGDLPIEVIAYLSQKPELLHNWVPTKDLVNQPSPRTWEAAGKILKLGLPDHLEYEALRGTIGDSAATDFVALLRALREGIDFDLILSSPGSAPIPERSKIGVLYAISGGLANLADRDNFSAICTYLERMVSERGLSEFAILTLQTSLNRDPNLHSTKAFTKLITGNNKISQLLNSLAA
jgi:hypothetical protein